MAEAINTTYVDMEENKSGVELSPHIIASGPFTDLRHDNREAPADYDVMPLPQLPSGDTYMSVQEAGGTYAHLDPENMDQAHDYDDVTSPEHVARKDMSPLKKKNLEDEKAHRPKTSSSEMKPERKPKPKPKPEADDTEKANAEKPPNCFCESCSRKRVIVVTVVIAVVVVVLLLTVGLPLAFVG